MTTKKLVKPTLLLLALNPFFLSAQSIAHQKSEYAIVDPVYCSEKTVPEPQICENAPTWIYGPSELECWRLQLLIQRKDSAGLNVGYPGVFHQPFHSAVFRLKLEKPLKIRAIRFKAIGQGKIYLDHQLINAFKASSSWHTFTSTKKIQEIEFELHSEKEPPALLLEDKNLSTSKKDWIWKTESENWKAASHFPQNKLGLPPHELEDPTVELKPVKSENRLYDFGRELFGQVLVKSDRKPVIMVGESVTEAMDTLNKNLEQSLEMIRTRDGSWITKNPLALRYVHTDTSVDSKITCRALFHPASYQGAFACSDSTLNRIWMSSAYTLRLCMHDFLLDGIKRDRLPWTGDLAMSLLVNAYTFHNAEMVRRTLVALGRAGINEKDINGIIDYSLWWVIAQDQYQLYFSDATHLNSEWKLIKETLHSLSGRCDASGFLLPKDSWLFIDWVNQKKWTALQILWWWAQESGARLAHRTGDTATESSLKASAEKLKTNLIACSWSKDKALYLSDPQNPDSISRHPNFLAVLSGLASQNQFEGIRSMLVKDQAGAVGTPYMAGFENMAIARLGYMQTMLDKVKEYWGAMLKQDATTFWEAYDATQKGNEKYSFYGRPYAKSLCHAWSAGPAAFMPSEIFGLTPLEDGWRKFTVKPNLGQLQWASVCLPTNYGKITVDVENGKITIQIPKGTTLIWKNRSIAGPFLLKDNL